MFYLFVRVIMCHGNDFIVEGLEEPLPGVKNIDWGGSELHFEKSGVVMCLYWLPRLPAKAYRTQRCEVIVKTVMPALTEDAIEYL